MAYQPRFSFNPGQYVNQDPGIQKFDFGSGFRALADQAMRQKSLDQNQDQFMKSQAQQQSQFDSTQSFQKKRAQDQNTQFSLELVDKKEDRQLQRDDKRAEQMKSTLMKARQAVVSGRYEEADALLGPLAEMGAEVNKSIGKDGKPIYKFKAPTYGDQPGPVKFDDINAHFSEQNQSQVPQTGTEQNPVDPMLQEKFPGEQSGSGDIVLEKQLDGILGKQGEGLLQATGGNQPEQSVAEQPPAQAEPGFDPYSLDTAAIQSQVDQRLNPYLKGLVQAFPERFRGRIANLSAGAKALGGTPEQTVENMQKPMDTAARLMGDELSAEASRARAFMSGENQAANRNFRIEESAWRRADNIGKSFDLTKRKLKLTKVQETINHLNQHNGSADGLLISTIRSMFESGVMTDKDFANTKSGIKTFFQQIKDGVDEKVIGTGLNPDSRAGLIRFMTDIAKDDKNAVAQAQDQLTVQLKRAQSYEEANTILDFITSHVPQNLWSNEVRELQGLPVEQKSGPMDKEGNYPTEPGKPANKAKSVNDEAEELLNGN